MPAENISVRAVVGRAGAAQSAIHYHFQNIERLYECASEAALNAAQGWWEDRLSALDPLAGRPVSAQLQVSVLTSTICDWAVVQRRLAMASRRMPSAAWQAAMQSFWLDLARRIGIGEYAETIGFYAAGEAARHLLVWDSLLDRALLEETTEALLTWLCARRFAGDDVRLTHRDLARCEYREPTRPLAGDTLVMAEAAAGLLAEQGYAGVTFRAVAARTGASLGKVLHLCGSKSELLRLALHRLYEREALGDARELFIAQTISPQVMLDELLDAVLSGGQPVLRAYDEIELAIYNGDEFRALRGVVRSMEDPSRTWSLQQMLGGKTPPASLVAAFSAIIRGIGFDARFAEPQAGVVDWRARQALMPFVSQV